MTGIQNNIPIKLNPQQAGNPFGGNSLNKSVPMNSVFSSQATSGQYSGVGNAVGYAQETAMLANYLDGFQSSTSTANQPKVDSFGETLGKGLLMTATTTIATAVFTKIGEGIGKWAGSLFGGSEKTAVDASKILNDPKASKSDIKKAIVSATTQKTTLEGKTKELQATAEQAASTLANAESGKGVKGAVATANAASAKATADKYPIPAKVTDAEGNVTNQKEIDQAMAVKKELEETAKTLEGKIAEEIAKDVLEATTAKTVADNAVSDNSKAINTAQSTITQLNAKLTAPKADKAETPKDTPKPEAKPEVKPEAPNDIPQAEAKDVKESDYEK